MVTSSGSESACILRMTWRRWLGGHGGRDIPGEQAPRQRAAASLHEVIEAQVESVLVGSDADVAISMAAWSQNLPALASR
jgi:hypothetical protein